ncbi:MAG TPA: aldo/keto reductase [Chthonomonadaceae bacterium]|nr:aldo/keto reductase [Chthonomonadaceae bacterium]
MDYTILGRTGLAVSVMGLGCGGHSRLGLATGHTQAEAIAVVQKALDLGVNFLDTAESYGTETVVGQALAGKRREAVVLSTKVSPRREGALATAAEIKERAEACLQRLRTDYVDVLHLHGVAADDYAYALSELLPALQELRTAGKVRFLGITEAFASDPSHRMLNRALDDACWDVIMAGFNLINQSARERLFVRTQQNNIGVLCMFAVRRALSRPEALRALMGDLAAQGLVEVGTYDPEDPLGFLVRDGSAASLPDAAYRFCRHEPGIHVVLSGTGSLEHLEANAASLTRPPLPPGHIEKLRRLFRRVDSVSGN